MISNTPNVRPKPKSILRKRQPRMRRQSIIKQSQATKPATTTKEPIAAPSKQRSTLKFAAPIKIIVIDPKSEYCKAVWCAIGIALADIAIGAVLMSAFYYSVNTGDSHAVICTFAFHFFSAQAILALHYANGWTAPMRTRHRKFAHVFLNICGIICAVVGTLLVLLKADFSEKMLEKPHGLTGLITGILIILTAIIGPIAYYRKKSCVKSIHMSLGIVTFIMSSICVCFGLTLKQFKAWAIQIIVYVLIALVVFYTVFIGTSSFMKCVSRF